MNIIILILVLILLGLSIYLIILKSTSSSQVVTPDIDEIAPTLTKEEVMNFKSEFNKSLNNMINQYSS
jgi:hypothetical protein